MSTQSPAPIALFVFNRTDVLAKAVESLLQNKLCKETDLYIFSDGARDNKPGEATLVEMVRTFIHSISGFRRIIIKEHPVNIGCRMNVRLGIDAVLRRHDRVIALEDDLLYAENFLQYMNDSLERYRDNNKVWCINGCCLSRKHLPIPPDYPFGAYFLPRNNSYGWGTWRNRWEKIDFDLRQQWRSSRQAEVLQKLKKAGGDIPTMLRDAALGRISSWAVSFTTTIANHGGLCLTPVNSFVSAQPSVGTHVGVGDDRAVHDLSKAQWPFIFPDNDSQDPTIIHSFILAMRKPKRSPFEQFKETASLLKWHTLDFIRTIKGRARHLLFFLHHIQRTLLKKNIGLRQDIEVKTLRLGSEYGGWRLADTILNAESIIYSLGVGEDASFDEELISRYQTKVHAFNPTPQSIAWVTSQGYPSAFIMHPYGIAAFDGTATFNPPSNPSHVSHTMLDRFETSNKAIVVPMKRLSTVMTELGHSRIDLLKMNVEGAEYQIIDDMLTSGIFPQQLLIQFHHWFEGVDIQKTRNALNELRASGYEIFNISSDQTVFCLIRN